MAYTEFDVLVTRVSDAMVVSVWGEVDVATAPALRTALATVLTERPRVLVIDLSAVTFLASSGMLVLAEAAAAGHVVVRVVAMSRECLRPICVTGLDAVLSMYGTVAEALV